MKADKGFSLLEILVAFSIMAVALGICLSIFSQGVNNARVAEDYIIATQLAESLLAKAGVETPLEPGVTQGQVLDKYSWQVKTEIPLLPTEVQDQTQLMEVQVTVQWGEQGRQISLTQLKFNNAS